MMKQLRRRGSIASAVAIGASVFGVVATSEPASADPPPTAIAMGDSFISGEGAGNYQPVPNQQGVNQTFPGWTANSRNAFFCHRSANASIEVADLPGIEQRVNLACSSGTPRDIVSPPYQYPRGRWVDSQIEQMRQVALTHDIDVVLIGLGANNSAFDFGSVGSKCVKSFFADAWIGWWEVWVDWLAGAISQDPCTVSDFPNAARMNAAQAETTNAIRRIVEELDQIDADGEHKVILQDYASPVPTDFDQYYRKAGGRTDTRDKFRKLGRRRYAGGCPVHRASLAPAAIFTENLGNMVANTTGAIKSQFPDLDITYLNVQRAFDGARLCEKRGSPGNALFTPIRMQRRPNGVFEQTMNRWNKLKVTQAAKTCDRYVQTCQESWHPTAAGHGVLGQCLSAAAAATASTVQCVRNPSNGSISTTGRPQTLQFKLTGTTVRTRQGVHARVDYKLTPQGALGATVTNVQVNAVAVTPDLDDPQQYQFPSSTALQGTFNRGFECLGSRGPQIRVTATANFAGQTYEFDETYVVEMSECEESIGHEDGLDPLDADLAPDTGGR